jgi:transcriptional regulator with XRE-family HTH domain
VSDEVLAGLRTVIKRLMTENDIKSGRQLALRAGINARAMDRKLTGFSPFDIPDLIAIAAVFDVTASDLLAWAERET